MKNIHSFRWLAAALFFATTSIGIFIAGPAGAGQSWHVVYTPATKKPEKFVGISCLTTSSCDTASSNNADDFRTQDGGKTWQNGVAASNDGMTSIACLINGECFAVGQGLGSLQILSDPFGNFGPSSPSYPNPNGDTVPSIACPSTQVCIAVGSFGSASGPAGIVWYSHNASASHPTWIRYGVTVANNAAGGFSSISCPSATTCFALDQLGGAIYETTNGGESFTEIPMSGISTSKLENSSLLGISCPTVSYHSCVVVGSNLFTGQPVVVDPHLTSSSWLYVPLPFGSAVLWSVSCVGTKFCEAVGENLAIQTTDGGNTWSGTKFPKNTGSLDSVSCPVAGTCYATSSSGYSGRILKIN